MSRESQLQARTDHPDTFIAIDPGDELVGVLTQVKRAWSDARTNGGRTPERGWYPLLRVRKDDGQEVAFHAFSTVAENEVLQARPEPGERVRIRYLGESKNAKKGQNAAKLFSLEVAGRSAARAAANVYDSLSQKPVAPVAPRVPETVEISDFVPEQTAFEDDDIPF